jgi:hypothetical protein
LRGPEEISSEPGRKGFQGRKDALKELGHHVERQVRLDKTCWQIDRGMLATPQEMEEFADGVYSFPELEELYMKRRAEEQATK